MGTNLRTAIFMMKCIYILLFEADPARTDASSIRSLSVRDNAVWIVQCTGRLPGVDGRLPGVDGHRVIWVDLEHMPDLSEELRKVGLKLKPSKCLYIFACISVECFRSRRVTQKSRKFVTGRHLEVVLT